MTTGVAIGNFFFDDDLAFLIHSFTRLIVSASQGVGLYYAGYNADHSPEPKKNVFQDLQNEISAAKIDQFLKYVIVIILACTNHKNQGKMMILTQYKKIYNTDT